MHSQLESEILKITVKNKTEILAQFKILGPD